LIATTPAVLACVAGEGLDLAKKWTVHRGRVMDSGRQSGDGDRDEPRRLRERVDQLEQLNAQLKDSEERLQILFEHAPDAYYLSDLKGTLVDGNAAAERITGYKKAELIGKSFLKLKLLSAGDLLRAASLLAKNLLGRSTGPDEFTLTRKDGTPVPVEILTHPVRIGNRRLVLGIARDISARKRTEHELRERAKELQGLYGLAEIAERKDVSLDELYQELTDILPSSWQHEEITCARTVMELESTDVVYGVVDPEGS
jgi:PAS domain S-box-containing protein